MYCFLCNLAGNATIFAGKIRSFIFHEAGIALLPTNNDSVHCFLALAPPTLLEAFSIYVSSDDSSCEENLFQMLAPYRKSFAVALLGEEEGVAKLEGVESALGDDGKMGEEACCSLFQTWLGGSGRLPVTWDTLAVVLKEVGLPSLVTAVKKRKQKKGGASITKEGAGSNILACVEQMFR